MIDSDDARKIMKEIGPPPLPDPDDISDRYFELIYAVGEKHPAMTDENKKLLTKENLDLFASRNEWKRITASPCGSHPRSDTRPGCPHATLPKQSPAGCIRRRCAGTGRQRTN